MVSSKASKENRFGGKPQTQKTTKAQTLNGKSQNNVLVVQKKCGNNDELARLRAENEQLKKTLKAKSKVKEQLIPYPTRSKGDSFSLQDAMELGHDKPFYTHCRRVVGFNAIRAGMDPKVHWKRQSTEVLGQVISLSRDTEPYLGRFENTWAIKEILKGTMGNKRYYRNKISKHKTTSGDDDDDEDAHGAGEIQDAEMDSMYESAGEYAGGGEDSESGVQRPALEDESQATIARAPVRRNLQPKQIAPVDVDMDANLDTDADEVPLPKGRVPTRRNLQPRQRTPMDIDMDANSEMDADEVPLLKGRLPTRQNLKPRQRTPVDVDMDTNLDTDEDEDEVPVPKVRVPMRRNLQSSQRMPVDVEMDANLDTDADEDFAPLSKGKVPIRQNLRPKQRAPVDIDMDVNPDTDPDQNLDVLPPKRRVLQPKQRALEDINMDAIPDADADIYNRGLAILGAPLSEGTMPLKRNFQPKPRAPDVNMDANWDMEVDTFERASAVLQAPLPKGKKTPVKHNLRPRQTDPKSNMNTATLEAPPPKRTAPTKRKRALVDFDEDSNANTNVATLKALPPKRTAPTKRKRVLEDLDEDLNPNAAILGALLPMETLPDSDSDSQIAPAPLKANFPPNEAVLRKVTLLPPRMVKGAGKGKGKGGGGGD